MYMAKECSVWPVESKWFDTEEEAISWAESHIKGKWKIWKKGFPYHKEVYSNH